MENNKCNRQLDTKNNKAMIHRKVERMDDIRNKMPTWQKTMIYWQL